MNGLERLKMSSTYKEERREELSHKIINFFLTKKMKKRKKPFFFLSFPQYFIAFLPVDFGKNTFQPTAGVCPLKTFTMGLQ